MLCLFDVHNFTVLHWNVRIYIGVYLIVSLELCIHDLCTFIVSFDMRCNMLLCIVTELLWY